MVTVLFYIYSNMDHSRLYIDEARSKLTIRFFGKVNIRLGQKEKNVLGYMYLHNDTIYFNVT